MILKITKGLLLALFIIQLVKPVQIQQYLPSLRQIYKPDILKPYRIQQLQTINIYCSPQSEVIGKLIKQCHIHEPQIDIYTFLPMVYTKNAVKYLYNSPFNILFILNDKSLEMYSLYNSKQTNQISQIKFSNNCSKDMVSLQGQQIIFIFSCEAIFVVTISKNNLVLKTQITFQQNLDIRSALRFSDLLIVLTYTKGVYIYGIDLELNLHKLAQILLANGQQKLQIADAHYSNNKLILLDKNKGVLYYKRQYSNFIYENSLSLELQEQIQYKSIQIWKNSTFVSVQAQTQSMVVELQQMDNKMHLVRYYKGYDEIVKMQIINNSLIIHSTFKIDIFPINRDPRAIKSLLNGYSYLHDQKIASFFYLYDDIFLIQRSHSAEITKWTLKDKQIQCDFKDTGVYQILLEQPCSANTQGSFNSVCQQIEIAEITVYHKDNYVWLLLICIGVFIAIILFLIYWREQKVARIAHILKQIKGFKLKEKKQIEFKEVNLSQKDEQNAKQIAWSDLVESKQHQDEELDPYQEYINSQRNNLN